MHLLDGNVSDVLVSVTLLVSVDSLMVSVVPVVSVISVPSEIVLPELVPEVDPLVSRIGVVVTSGVELDTGMDVVTKDIDVAKLSVVVLSVDVSKPLVVDTEVGVSNPWVLVADSVDPVLSEVLESVPGIDSVLLELVIRVGSVLPDVLEPISVVESVLSVVGHAVSGFSVVEISLDVLVSAVGVENVTPEVVLSRVLAEPSFSGVVLVSEVGSQVEVPIEVVLRYPEVEVELRSDNVLGSSVLVLGFCVVLISVVEVVWLKLDVSMIVLKL